MGVTKLVVNDTGGHQGFYCSFESCFFTFILYYTIGSFNCFIFV